MQDHTHICKQDIRYMIIHCTAELTGIGEAALFYSPVDSPMHQTMHHSNACLMHR